MLYARELRHSAVAPLTLFWALMEYWSPLSTFNQCQPDTIPTLRFGNRE
jgi:hypothetical protein